MNNVIFKLYCIGLFVLPSFISVVFSQQVWSSLGTGTNGSVHALAVYGGYLIAAGSFSTAGGQNVNHIARWNGNSWTQLGLGTNDDIYALALFNGNLIAGGKFTTAGGLNANRIAVWNGSAWSSLGQGLNGEVFALLTAYSDLIVGGAFTNSGADLYLRVARWYNGWTAVGTGFNDTVYSLGLFSSMIYAGGVFTNAGTASTKRIAVWNGASWQPVGLGVDNGCVNALKPFGSYIAIGGTFTTIGGSTVNRIARWNGSAWNIFNQGMDNSVFTIYSSGSYIYAGGLFEHAGPLPVSKVAVFTGSSWAALGSGLGGNNAVVNAIAGYGGRIICAGSFTSAGGNSANNIAAWGSPIGVRTISGNGPGEYSLMQNFPNPFNPVTTIRFGIPAGSGSSVSIIVYDINGRIARELVKEKLLPGEYEVDFDGTLLSSGAYFYRMISGDVSFTKKMVLVR